MTVYLAGVIVALLLVDAFMNALNGMHHKKQRSLFMFKASKLFVASFILFYWMIIVNTQTWGLFLFLVLVYMLFVSYVVTVLNPRVRSFKVWVKAVVIEPVFVLFCLGVLTLFFYVMMPWLLVVLTTVFLSGVYVYILVRHQRWLSQKFRLVPYHHQMNDMPFMNAKQEKNVYMIDSKHVNIGINAMYLAIGKHVHILVSRKLLALLNSFETEAIIVHELGHAKYKHLQKRLWTGFSILILFFFINIMHAQLYPVESLGFPAMIRLLLINVALIWPIRHFLVFVMHKQEYQADYYCYEMGYKEALMSSLRRLSRRVDDKAYHPSYTKYYRSHPTIKARIRRLKALK